MHFLTTLNPLYVLSGLVVGLLVGLTGVGGGSLMTPLLVLVFGIHPSTAVGTDLLYASMTKTVGTGVHGWRRTVNWSVVGRLALGSLPAAGLTLYLLARAHAKGGVGGSLLTEVLAGALIATAVAMLFRDTLVAFFRRRGPPSALRTTVLTVVLGAVLGVLVSMTSVGAGAIGMTVLLILYPTLPASRLVGSDIAHAVPLTLLAGLGHWLIGDVNFGLLGTLLIGSVPGVIVGSLISSRLSDRLLRPVMAVVLALVAWKLLT